MKKGMLVLGVMLLLMVGAVGCVPTTQDINTLTGNVDILQKEVDNVQVLLTKSELLNKEKVAKVNEKIDQVQEHIVVVNEAVKEKADESVVEQLRAGNEASRPFNPYADEVNAILGLATVIVGLFAKKKIDDAKKIEAKRQADKAGREKTLREIAAMPEVEITAPIVKKLMYTNIGEARTRNKVAYVAAGTKKLLRRFH